MNTQSIYKKVLAWVGAVFCSAFSLFCTFGFSVLLWAYFTQPKYADVSTLEAACYMLMGTCFGIAPAIPTFAWIFNWKGLRYDQDKRND